MQYSESSNSILFFHSCYYKAHVCPVRDKWILENDPETGKKTEKSSKTAKIKHYFPFSTQNCHLFVPIDSSCRAYLWSQIIKFASPAFGNSCVHCKFCPDYLWKNMESTQKFSTPTSLVCVNRNYMGGYFCCGWTQQVGYCPMTSR